MDNQLQGAVQFFKSEKIYERLFSAFRKKYESLGRIGGTVSVRGFSASELEEIGRFFGLPGEQLEKKGTISLRAFEEQIQYTKFSSIHLKQLLDAYFDEKIMSKKEQQLLKEAGLRAFLEKLQKQYDTIAFWLRFIEEQRRDSRWILQIAEREPDNFQKLVVKLDHAYQSLPMKAERLPMFSQRITRDPHAFDLQTDLGRMFIHLLSVGLSILNGESSLAIPSSTEEINHVLQQYHIYRDDLLNFVTCANLIAETSNGIHPVWEAAAKEQTVQIVPVRELVSLINVRPVEGEIVWVVENSGVCATLLDYSPDAPIICTNGQFTLATWILMDLLVKARSILYYAGDFDPEGLGMADRLVGRYGSAVRLWHMDEVAYKKSKPSKELSKERIEKLSSITADELLGVTEEMRRFRRAGYQEALVEWMIGDIRAMKEK